MTHTWKIPCRYVGRGRGPIKLNFPIGEVEEWNELVTSTDGESDYTDLIYPDDTPNFIPALLADLICFERIDEFRQNSKTPDAFLYEINKSRDILEELNSSVVEYAHFAHRSLAIFKHELALELNGHLAHGNPKDLPWTKAFTEVASYTEKLHSADPSDRERILAECPKESLEELGSEELKIAFNSIFDLSKQNTHGGTAEYEGYYERIYSKLIENYDYHAFPSNYISALEKSEERAGCLLTKRQKVVWLASALEEGVAPNELAENAFSYVSENYCKELWQIATSDPLSKAASDIKNALSNADGSIQNHFSNHFPRTPGETPKNGCAALIVPYSKQQKLIIAFNGVADDDQSLKVNGVTICEYFNKEKARASTLHNLDMLLKSNAFSKKYDVARVHTDNLCVIEKPYPTSCVTLGELMRGVKSVPNGSPQQMNRMFSCAERKAIAFVNRERQQSDTFEGYLYASREVCFICDWTINHYNHRSNWAKARNTPVGFNVKIDRKRPACPTSPDSLKLKTFHDLSMQAHRRRFAYPQRLQLQSWKIGFAKHSRWRP